MSWMMHLIRKLLGIPQPSITRDAALQIASNEAAERGDIPPRDPTVQEGLRIWLVLLDPSIVPCRIVEIDNQTGQVKRYLSPPR
jgi:hypothetical protein